jgi:HAD superfamily hydrolase (TIGR01509 family)
VPLTTIFFDAGGTIVFADPALTLAPLAARNHFPSQEHLHAAERDAKRQFDAFRAGHHSADGQYWDIFYRHLFHQLSIADDPDLRAQLVVDTRHGMNWRRVRPDTRDVLQRLRRRYRLGLISNSDGSVRRLLEAVQLADCFDSITDSRLCGFEKPDPRIFQCAMSELGARPEESLYVGDVYSLDMVGARNVGMSAVLIDVAGVYRDSGHPRVESLAELESRLEQFHTPAR